MFKTFLLATDGSDNAERAAVVAGQLAAACSAQLTIIHVAPPFVSLTEVTEGPLAKRLPKNLQDEIQDFLKEMDGWEKTPFARIPAPESVVQFLSDATVTLAEKVARDHGVRKVNSVITEGDPAREIVKEAGRMKADMIVIGSRGLGRLEELVMGSVSLKALQLAACLLCHRKVVGVSTSDRTHALLRRGSLGLSTCLR